MQKNKCLCILLLTAFLLLSNMMVQPVMAAGSMPTFEIGTYTALPGETIEVPVMVRNSPGIAALKLKVAYDDSRLELTGITYGSWNGNFQQPQRLSSPVSLTWYNGTGNYTEADSVFATLAFRVLDDAEFGEAAISMTYDPNNVYNIAEKNIDFAVENGSVMVDGQTECMHTWDNGTVTREPSCTTDGEMTYTCLQCGEIGTEVIPKLDHDYKYEVTEPTCTAGGYTTYICSRCGDSYIGDRTDPLEHEYENGVCIYCGVDEGTLEAAVAEVVISGVSTMYDDINEAITALKTTVSADKAVFRLMQDIELAEPLGILDSVFTFDLNGHAIRSTADGLRLARADVTLVDSSAAQTGRITAEAGNGISIAIETKLTVCSGMVEGSNYAISMPSVSSTVLRQLVITGGTLKSGGVGVVLARDDVRISGGTMLLDGAESNAVYIQQYGGTVSFEGYTGELLGMTITKIAPLTPSMESYHLPAGYCFYKYDEDTGVVGTKPVTMITEYYQSYIIGKQPHVPEELNCTISADKAILRGDELGLHMQLYMAAYDADGRMLAVTDTVEYIDGSYVMTVSAENIIEVRLFIMDGRFVPIIDAYHFN